MKRADEMTVEEMGAALGLRRDNRRDGWWQWLDRNGVVAEPETSDHPDGPWRSWPVGESSDGQKRHPTEHAAMSRLYALRFPEADEPETEPAAKAPPRSSAVVYAQGAGGGGGAQTPVRATTVKIPDGATTAAITLGPSGASIAFGFAATTQPPTPAPTVEPKPATARESANPVALDTRAVLEWLDSPVPMDEDRRPRFLRMAEAIGRAVGGGR